jgi:basic amino acid/polyamine antiporter, APA family
MLVWTLDSNCGQTWLHLTWTPREGKINPEPCGGGERFATEYWSDELKTLVIESGARRLTFFFTIAYILLVFERPSSGPRRRERTAPDDSASWPARLSRSARGSRKLSVFDTFCLGLNAIIGSGIFIFPGLLAQEVGPASIVAFAVCGVLLVFVALCYAELGSMFRQNGGCYVYAKEAFGPLIGFGIGWICWMTSIFSWAAVASAVGSNLAYFHPVFNQPYVVKMLAAALIGVFTIINYLGIKLGAWTVNFFTLAKVVPLVLFVAIGAVYVQPSQYYPFRNPSTGSFSFAVFLALWSLQGFEVVSLPAGESCEPERAVPIAAVGSLLGASLLYILIQAVAVGVHPGLASAGTKPLAEAAARFMGPFGGGLMAVAAVASMVGFNAGNAVGSPRFLSALAQDRHLPSALSAAHPRYRTPSLAIMVTGAFTACAALVLRFQSLVDLANLVVVLQYAATCMALIQLRRQRPEMHRRFRIPFGIPVAVIGCAVSLWLVKEVKANEFQLAGLVLGVGFLAMALFRLKRLEPHSG